MENPKFDFLGSSEFSAIKWLQNNWYQYTSSEHRRIGNLIEDFHGTMKPILLSGMIKPRKINTMRIMLNHFLLRVDSDRNNALKIEIKSNLKNYFYAYVRSEINNLTTN